MPVDTAVRQPNVSNQQHFAALAAFPSPASVHESLNSPVLEVALRDLQALGQRPPGPYTPSSSADLLPTQPDDVQLESVLTPPTDNMPEPDMNLVVGGALAPVHSTPPPRPPPRRSRPGFRLPSFQSLGIANPNPDRFGFDGMLAHSTPDTMPLSMRARYADPGFTPMFPDLANEPAFQDLMIDSAPKTAGGRAVQAPFHQLVNTLTPPAESGYSAWSPLQTVTAAMDSPATDRGNAAPTDARREGAANLEAGGTSSQIPVRARPETDSRPPWIRVGINVLVENLRTRPVRIDSLRVISHALPSPSTTGHIFSEVIGAVSSSTPGSASSPMTWINVFHAIPGKFNLQDLPRSPPTTPGPAVGGEDYFTEKVFDSAVSIADYQQDLSELPRSPCPVVPPNSIDISIVERYIPPSTSNEFATMFDSNGPSILIDRLIELSPNNGSLMLIYPTRTGAETFMQEYLSPILDPILRSFAVTQRFPAGLNRALSSMISVDHLLDHETLQHRMAALCARLTQRSSAAERFHGRRPHLTLSYASKQLVDLRRDAWARDWWTKQEKPRIREALVKHAREAQKLPDKDFGGDKKPASELLQELLHLVETKEYDAGKEPIHGVEVSVFVITRSS